MKITLYQQNLYIYIYIINSGEGLSDNDKS